MGELVQAGVEEGAEDGVDGRNAAASMMVNVQGSRNGLRNSCSFSSMRCLLNSS
jgi:hypothetical protein